MLSYVLKNRSIAFRLSVKGCVSALLTVLAVALPQIAHIVGGASAGAVWMPMYAPVLLAGCILGWRWGLAVGVLSPVASFGFTTIALGSAMPIAARLPYMILELAVFGVVSGLFSKKIMKNALYAFAAVITAQVCGRLVYVIYSLIAGNAFSAITASVQTGLVGIYLQAVIVPVAVIILAKMLLKDKSEANE